VAVVESVEDDEDNGYCVSPADCRSLIEWAVREGVCIWDVGTVNYDGGDGGPYCEDHVFTDQCCTACGHTPCPCCGAWCDVLLDGGGLCCDGKCTYAAEPRFFLGDGTPWEG
jgi:hypothetical protein